MPEDSDYTGSNGPTHPRCADCGVPMWRIKVERRPDGDYLHFECKACDAVVVQRAPTPR